MTTDEQAVTTRLTGKQRAFIDAYLGEANYNGTQAARIAGYSDTSDHSLEVEASRTLRIAEVQREISMRMNAARLSPELVIDGLTRSAEGALADKAYGAATAAYRELGRILALFVDRTEIDLNAEVRRVSLEIGIPEDELRAEIERQGK